MTPDEIELRVPRYFRREREQEIESRRKFIEATLRNLGELEEKAECKKMTELEAIRLIQVELLSIKKKHFTPEKSIKHRIKSRHTSEQDKAA